MYRRIWDLIVASPFAVADQLKDDPARNREQRKVSDSAAYLAEHIGEVIVQTPGVTRNREEFLS